MSGRRHARQAVGAWLAAPEWNPEAPSPGGPPADLVRALQGFLASPKELVRWRGARSLGAALARLAGGEPAAAREIVRRLLWSLNEESGSIGWGAPAALAEALARDAGLADDYLALYLSHLDLSGPKFLEFPPLQQGLAWGVGRLAADRRPALLAAGGARLLRVHLVSPDPGVRGHAAWALGELQDAAARAGLEARSDDPGELAFWDGRGLRVATVGGLVREALTKLAAPAT